MHLKYRPTSLDEVVGLDHIKNSLAEYEFDVPIMFVGERGCGKTTLANILAKEFGASGVNIKSINCGYYRKIQDMRDEIDDLIKTSLFGNKKVLILDEIHRLTKDSYAAWLTPLESLPNNVLVFACTTEPEALPETLCERFRIYRVNPLTQKEARLLIEQVVQREGITIPKWVRMKVIEKSRGNPRVILLSLPKVMGITDEAEVDQLLEVASMGDDSDALEILKLLISMANWNALKDALNKSLKDSSPEAIRVSLMNLIGGRLLSQYATNHTELRLLTRLYGSLKRAESFPEKANLVVALYDGFYLFNRKEQT